MGSLSVDGNNPEWHLMMNAALTAAFRGGDFTQAAALIAGLEVAGDEIGAATDLAARDLFRGRSILLKKPRASRTLRRLVQGPRGGYLESRSEVVDHDRDPLSQHRDAWHVDRKAVDGE